MAVLIKAVYICNSIPVKIPMTSFSEIKKITLKAHLEAQKDLKYHLTSNCTTEP
jgi:hypothetical protein